MTSLPGNLVYNPKRNKEKPMKKTSELDILKRDLKIMSDNRCKASLYHIIKDWEEF